MNYIETFQFLGHAHAVTYEPKRLDDINMLLPYFEIFKNDMGNTISKDTIMKNMIMLLGWRFGNATCAAKS